jgi:DNA-binding transcriptional LysR family regulator
VGRFRRAYPRVTVRLRQPEDTAGVAELLLRGVAEVGLAEAPVTGERLVSHRLGTQDIVAVLPPGTAGADPLPVTELARLPLVTLPTGTSSRRLLDAALAAAGASPRIAVETDQREALIPLVLAGAGASILPSPMAEGAARQGAVVAPLEPPLRRELAVVHREAPLSPAAAAFVAMATAPTPPSG